MNCVWITQAHMKTWQNISAFWRCLPHPSSDVSSSSYDLSLLLGLRRVSTFQDVWLPSFCMTHSGLNRAGFHRLIYLSAGSLGSATTWKGFVSVAMLDELCHRSWALGFKILKPGPMSLSLSVPPSDQDVEASAPSPAPCPLVCHRASCSDNNRLNWNGKQAPGKCFTL